MTDDVAGVDGCRGGWVVATRDGWRVVPSFATIAPKFALIGVDMPIGLPDGWQRAADRAAREFIRPRGSCVFPTPPRSLIDHDDYAAANAASKARFGVGLTRQTFHLFPKIRDVDRAIDAESQHRFLEVHPECSFTALTGHVLAPKRTAEGREQRTEALVGAFGPIEQRPSTTVRPDDVLDAYAVLWTVLRHRRGESRIFGGDETDRRGLVMRIVA
jgi:predicted RNase H-like nuclease